MVERMNKVARARRALLQEHGREPSPAEIAAEARGMTAKQVEEILKLGQEPVSLETPVGGEEGDAALGDFIEDTLWQRPHELVADAAARRTTWRRRSRPCRWRERRVLELRYGLAGDAPMTLEDIGTEVGVTRERVRQIESKTLAKLKYSEGGEKLQGTTDDTRSGANARSPFPSGSSAGLLQVMERERMKFSLAGSSLSSWIAGCSISRRSRERAATSLPRHGARQWLARLRREQTVGRAGSVPGSRRSGSVREAIVRRRLQAAMEHTRVPARGARYVTAACAAGGAGRGVAPPREEILVAEAGGPCQLCGYDRVRRRTPLPSRRPQQKQFGLAQRGCTRSLARLRQEAAKCCSCALTAMPKWRAVS